MNHKTLAIVGAFTLLLALAAFSWLYFTESAGNTVEFVSASGVSWYRVKGDTLAPVAAPANADALAGPSGAQASSVLLPPGPHFAILLKQGGVEKNLGTGRPLGFLADGSLLALTPLGIARVKDDGTAFQLAGTRASTTPIGVAAPDLSVIALADPVSGAVLVYRFDVKKNAATLLGSVSLPAPTSAALSADEITQAMRRAGLGATSTEERLTTEQAIRLSAELKNIPSYLRLSKVEAIGYASDTVYVRTGAGMSYALSLSAGTVGEPRLLTAVQD